MVTIKRRTSWGTMGTILALICVGLFSFINVFCCSVCSSVVCVVTSEVTC